MGGSGVASSDPAGEMETFPKKRMCYKNSKKDKQDYREASIRHKRKYCKAQP